jgi:hypothetical protein
MKKLFFASLLFISFAVSGQRMDYLVKKNGDTLYGNVQLRNKAFFISGPNSPETEVSIDDATKIKSVNYKGSTVVHCLLQLYTDNLDELELDYIKREVIDTVLILDEILTTPTINLYYGKDKLKTPFYFYKTPSDASPVQLVVRYFLQGGLANYTNDRAKYRGERSKVNIVEDKGYVNQLRAIMDNCDKIAPGTWEILSYRDYSLKQLIKKYNRCN